MKIGYFGDVRENLFYIGVIIFSLMLLIEHLFSVNTNTIHFFKGFGIGLELVGAVLLIIMRISQR